MALPVKAQWCSLSMLVRSSFYLSFTKVYLFPPTFHRQSLAQIRSFHQARPGGNRRRVTRRKQATAKHTSLHPLTVLPRGGQRTERRRRRRSWSRAIAPQWRGERQNSAGHNPPGTSPGHPRCTRKTCGQTRSKPPHRDQGLSHSPGQTAIATGARLSNMVEPRQHSRKHLKGEEERGFRTQTTREGKTIGELSPPERPSQGDE